MCDLVYVCSKSKWRRTCAYYLIELFLYLVSGSWELAAANVERTFKSSISYCSYNNLSQLKFRQPLHHMISHICTRPDWCNERRKNRGYKLNKFNVLKSRRQNVLHTNKPHTATLYCNIHPCHKWLIVWIDFVWSRMRREREREMDRDQKTKEEKNNEGQVARHIFLLLLCVSHCCIAFIFVVCLAKLDRNQYAFVHATT